GMGDVPAVESFFGPDGGLVPGASRTGSSRYAADGTRLPCPPESPRGGGADAPYIASPGGPAAAVEALPAPHPPLSFPAFTGGTALHWAYFAGAPAIVEMLLRAGADPERRDHVVRCPPRAFGICAPANWGWLPKVRQRLAEDPSLVEVVGGRGTPLHEAARERQLEIGKLLVDAGADPGRRTPDGETALDLARARPDRERCAEVARWLTDRGAP